MPKKFELLSKNLVAQALSSILGFGFVVACTRLMSLHDYGDLRYVMTLLPLLMAFTLPAYDTVILNATSLHQSIAYWRIVKIRMFGGVLGSVAILIGLAFTYKGISDSLLFYMLCTAFLLPFYETGSGYKNYLIGVGLRVKSLNLTIKNRIISIALFITLSIPIIFEKVLSIKWLYPINLISLILPTFLTSLHLIKKKNRILKFRNQNGSVQLSNSIMSTIAGLISTLTFSLDKILVGSYFGSADLAMYAVLVMIPQELARFSDSLLPLYYKRLFLDKNNKMTYKKIILIFLLIVICLFLYSIIFHIFSYELFGNKYKYSINLILLSSLLIISQSFEYYFFYKIYNKYGAGGHLNYSIYNLLITGGILFLAVGFQSLYLIIILIILKQVCLNIIYFKFMIAIDDFKIKTL